MDMNLKEISKKRSCKFFFITLFFRQNDYHKHGVSVHTLKVVYKVLIEKDYKFLAAAILHDIGKPYVAYQRPQDIENNIYKFTNHEEKSYEIIKSWPFVSTWTKNIVRYHFIIIDLKRKKENNDKAYIKLEQKWNSFDKKFQEELETFLKYDNFGKV
jgi:hypothetical protein